MMKLPGSTTSWAHGQTRTKTEHKHAWSVTDSPRCCSWTWPHKSNPDYHSCHPEVLDMFSVHASLGLLCATTVLRQSKQWGCLKWGCVKWHSKLFHNGTKANYKWIQTHTLMLDQWLTACSMLPSTRSNLKPCPMKLKAHLSEKTYLLQIPKQLTQQMLAWRSASHSQAKHTIDQPGRKPGARVQWHWGWAQVASSAPANPQVIARHTYQTVSWMLCPGHFNWYYNGFMIFLQDLHLLLLMCACTCVYVFRIRVGPLHNLPVLIGPKKLAVMIVQVMASLMFLGSSTHRAPCPK